MILADEPTGNLDSKSSRAVIRSFQQARDALEATIFMVTHDSYAASFCDRVIILRDGVVWRTLEKGATDRSAFQDQLLDAIRDMSRSERMKTFFRSMPACGGKTGTVRASRALLLLLRAADHRLCMHDALAHHSLRLAGGRRQPQAGDDGFVLAVIGCGVFTTYAAGLFFRQKSRETGVFLALGASCRQLRSEMGKELAVLSWVPAPQARCWAVLWPGPCGSCFGCFWWTLRRCLSPFDPRSYLLALAFCRICGGGAVPAGRTVHPPHEHHRYCPGVP